MTALDTSMTTAEHAFAVPVDVAALLEENAHLRQRVGDLESIVAGYRGQLNEVVTSTSWRLTSPLRALAMRARVSWSRLRRTARRWRSRTSEPTHLVGLCAPDPALLPATSPLRRAFDPATTRRRPRIVPATGLPRVLVVAHVHYPELWPDIDDRLARMPEAFDLLVTVTEGVAESAVPRIESRYPTARVFVVPNRGRDWAPLVNLAGVGLLGGYTAIAKVHTKKSAHRIDGDGWRLKLLDGVLESPEAIRRIVDLIEADRGVGIVVPSDHVADAEHWGSNQAIVETLTSRAQLAFDPQALRFAAGSMFWCRPSLLERLADFSLELDDFEPECGQFDGTTAHALERLVGLMAQEEGMAVIETMEVPSRLRASRRSDVRAHLPALMDLMKQESR